MPPVILVMEPSGDVLKLWCCIPVIMILNTAKEKPGRSAEIPSTIHSARLPTEVMPERAGTPTLVASPFLAWGEAGLFRCKAVEHLETRGTYFAGHFKMAQPGVGVCISTCERRRYFAVKQKEDLVWSGAVV